MAIKRAVLKGKTIRAPQFTDDEAYLRVGIPHGISMQTGGNEPTVCDEIGYSGSNPHNSMKGGKMCGDSKKMRRGYK